VTGDLISTDACLPYRGWSGEAVFEGFEFVVQHGG
jgi:hypothetical protein